MRSWREAKQRKVALFSFFFFFFAHWNFNFSAVLSKIVSYQRLVYAHSAHCPGDQSQCTPYQLHDVAFYSSQDLPLGEFLTKFLFSFFFFFFFSHQFPDIILIEQRGVRGRCVRSLWLTISEELCTMVGVFLSLQLQGSLFLFLCLFLFLFAYISF